MLRLVAVQWMTHPVVQMSGAIFRLYEPSVMPTRVLFWIPYVIQFGSSGMINPCHIQAPLQLHKNSKCLVSWVLYGMERPSHHFDLQCSIIFLYY